MENEETILMNILWTVNTHSPSIANQIKVKSIHAISWVEAMSEQLKKIANVELAIAAPADVSSIIKKEIGEIVYYAVPNTQESWKAVIDEFKPEIIHQYGTEKSHNLNVCSVAQNIPIIISLQGILSEYQRHYYGGIDISTIIKYTPIRDIIRPSGIISGRRDFIRRSKVERQLLNSVKYVEGRSTWDRVAALNINPQLNYYYCPRMLRKAFYEVPKWDLGAINRHTIFVSQGDYPIKGVHFVFMALAKLKEKYPDVKLIVTGNDMFGDMKGIKRFIKPGYKQYIYDLAEKLDILDSIEYVGKKSAEGMAELYSKVHVAVIPSAIENAPNSLAEAMIMGTPCIATYVGGNMDMMQHGKEGFLYCYNEPNMLAEYVSQIFESDELASAFSHQAIIRATNDHSQGGLTKLLLGIYQDVIRRENYE